MATQYTPILQLALPVTGELNGTWGDVVNDNITSMVEEAIAGLATISTWTTNAHTLTTADGVTDEARCAMLVLQTGSGGTALSAAGQVICPALTKLYVVKNAAAYAVTVKTSGGSGVAIAAGDTAFVFCDGTNVNACVTQIINGHITGNLTVDGNTTLGDSSADTVTINAGSTTLNDGGAIRFEDNAGGEYVAIKAPATVTATYTLTLPIDDGTNGQALITDGAGNLSWSTAASGDVYGPASATDNAVSRFDGTTGKLIQNSGVIIDDSNNVTGVVNLTSSGSVTLSGGTANGVAYLNGSKVLTTGSALTFDGTNLGVGTTSQTAKLDVTGVIRSTSSASTPSSGAGLEITYDSGSSSSYLTSYNRSSSSWINLTLNSANTIFGISGTEGMRLTSTGLGIGTSSPGGKLNVYNGPAAYVLVDNGRITLNGYNVASSISDVKANALCVLNTTVNDGINLLSGITNNYHGFIQAYNSVSTSSRDLILQPYGGNLGLGVTPSSWTNCKAIDVSTIGAVFADGFSQNNQAGFATNAYRAGAAVWYYKATAAASYYAQDLGAHKFFTAPSGTAGDAITFTQAMTLDASGNLGIGTSSPSAPLAFANSAGTAGAVNKISLFTDGSSPVYGFGLSANQLNYVVASSAAHVFYNNAPSQVERMRLDASGNLGLGVTPVSWSPLALQVGGWGGIQDMNGVANQIAFRGNSYYSGGDKFIQATGYASTIALDATSGSVIFYKSTNQSSGIGSAVTYAAAMTLDASGVLSMNGGAVTGNVNAFRIYNDGAAQTSTTSNSYGFGMLNTVGGLTYSAGTSGYHGFYTANTERMRLTSAGKVGIGTTAPQGTLEVNDSSAYAGNTLLCLSGNESTRYNLKILNAYTAVTYGDIGYNFRTRFDNVDFDYNLMLVNGNVGIGTSSPAYALDVTNSALNNTARVRVSGTTDIAVHQCTNNAGNFYFAIDNSTGSAFGTSGYGRVIYSDQAYPMVFSTNATERMRIDSSGNVGIGTSSPGAKLDVNGSIAIGANNRINTNDSAASLYIYSGAGARGGQIDFVGGIAVANAGCLLFRTGTAVDNSAQPERMRIDSSGTVILKNNPAGNALQFYGSGGSENARLGINASNGLDFAVGSTSPRMTIDSSGNVLVGTTSAQLSGKLSVVGTSTLKDATVPLYVWNSGTSGTLIDFEIGAGATVGTITTNGTTTAYNTSSDYRLKENIQPMQNALAVVAQLNPVTYTWKADGSDGQGFIAHELQAVVPDCVTGEKDAVDAEGNPVYQGIDTSFLVATLTKALQEAHGLIKDLESRIAALEAK